MSVHFFSKAGSSMSVHFFSKARSDTDFLPMNLYGKLDVSSFFLKSGKLDVSSFFLKSTIGHRFSPDELVRADHRAGRWAVGWLMVALRFPVAGRSSRLSGPSAAASSASTSAILVSSRRTPPGRTPAGSPGRGCRGRRGRSPRCRAVMRSWEPPRRAAWPVQNTMRETGAESVMFFCRSVRTDGRTCGRSPPGANCGRTPSPSRQWRWRRRARRPPARW